MGKSRGKSHQASKRKSVWPLQALVRRVNQGGQLCNCHVRGPFL